jgi:AcrR family transcriptional regulator
MPAHAIHPPPCDETVKTSNGLPPARTEPKSGAKPAPRNTRAEKAERTYRALVDAAVKVIGKLGYEGASISNITAQAKVAQGTFYNYFESRQDLLDRLLPMMGKEMTEYIKVRMDPHALGAEREKQRMMLYFDFLSEHPWFHRLVNEAETMAPKAHKVYFKHVSEGYMRSLGRSLERGEIKGYTAEQLEPLAYMLLAIRTYLAQRYVIKGKGAAKKVAEDVLASYVEFIDRALFK